MLRRVWVSDLATVYRDECLGFWASRAKRMRGLQDVAARANRLQSKAHQETAGQTPALVMPRVGQFRKSQIETYLRRHLGFRDIALNHRFSIFGQ